SLAQSPNNDHVGKVVRVDVRDEGQTDPVTEPLLRSPLATMSHEDCFQTPPGATGLAWSTDTAQEHCEAFRVGPPTDVVYALRSHPEPTAQMLLQDGWFKEVPDAETLCAVTTTGQEILAAWVRLADGR